VCVCMSECVCVCLRSSSCTVSVHLLASPSVMHLNVTPYKRRRDVGLHIHLINPTSQDNLFSFQNTEEVLPLSGVKIFKPLQYFLVALVERRSVVLTNFVVDRSFHSTSKMPIISDLTIGSGTRPSL
jgi:hypothetical protein